MSDYRLHEKCNRLQPIMITNYDYHMSEARSYDCLYDIRPFHKTYRLPIYIYHISWSQIADWGGAVVNRKSLKKNVECTSLQWGIMLFHHFCRLATCKYHAQNKMYLLLQFSNRLTYCKFRISHIYKTDFLLFLCRC